MNQMAEWARAFAAFWWDFIVGDDWRIAAGVITALAVTTALARTDVPAWWLLPLAVIGLLAVSLRRAIRTPGDSSPAKTPE